MQNLLRSTRAGALVEYGLLAGLVSAIAISSIWSLGRQVDFTHLVAALEVSDIHTPLGNFLENGDFDDVSGMTPTGYGYFSHTLSGWTSNNGLPFELHESGHMGMESVNGDYWLDTAASPGQMDIEQAAVSA